MQISQEQISAHAVVLTLSARQEITVTNKRIQGGSRNSNFREICLDHVGSQ
jgi:hypothetical protein